MRFIHMIAPPCPVGSARTPVGLGASQTSTCGMSWPPALIRSGVGADRLTSLRAPQSRVYCRVSSLAISGALLINQADTLWGRATASQVRLETSPTDNCSWTRAVLEVVSNNAAVFASYFWVVQCAFCQGGRARHASWAGLCLAMLGNLKVA